ncbi:MAG: IclR family transcriptional regulator [Alsobacter sp.]
MVEITEKRHRGRPRSATAGEDSPGVQSLDRAIVLMRLVADGNGMSLTELAARAELPPSTVYRMLSTLQRHGVVEFDDVNQLWFVGVELFRMGSSFLRRRKLAERGRAVIEALMAETGETANLAIADGASVVFVTQAESHQAIRAFFRPGTRSPYHASGVGKAILAFSPSDRRAALLGRTPLEAFTPRTRTTREALDADLSACRRRGYALDDEERDLGMRCIAAPIFNELGAPFGGVSVSGPRVRLDDAFVARVAPLVIAAGHRLTEAMGGILPRGRDEDD